MTRGGAMLALLAGLALVGCGDAQEPRAPSQPGPAAAAPSASARATARVEGCSDPAVRGSLTLIEEQSDQGIKKVALDLQMQGLPPGLHAVHVHETGACQPSCKAAGGHFDPGPAGMPSPDGNHPFHSGDLVNLEVNQAGRGRLVTLSTRFTLSPGPLGLFDEDGAAVIVHVDPDTFCPEGEVAGCAGGARAACGVIEPVSAR